MGSEAGNIRRLVINVPPRYMKSLLVSVLWPVWEWIQHPETRWVFTSYAESLAAQHSLDRRTLMLSPWYRASADKEQQVTEQSDFWHRHREYLRLATVLPPARPVALTVREDTHEECE